MKTKLLKATSLFVTVLILCASLSGCIQKHNHTPNDTQESLFDTNTPISSSESEKEAEKEENPTESDTQASSDTPSDAEEELETFDDTNLALSAILPSYNGEPLENPLYAGQGSNIYIEQNASEQGFDAFCSSLSSAGFRYYTKNAIASNRFATYVTQTQIVHVMYFASRKEIRIAVDKRGVGKTGFDLPALSGENIYESSSDSSFTMVETDNTGYPGGMCFILKLENGKFFIVDSGVNKASGRTSSAQWIYKSLKKLAGDDNIVVAGWLITHIHADHIGGLKDMAADSSITEKITVEQLIHNEPADAVSKELDPEAPDNCTWMNPIIEGFNVKSVIKAHPGQVLHYANAKITVLASQDVTLDKKDELKDANDLSVVTQIDFNGKKILMLGDAIKKQNEFLAQVYGSALKSDVLQVTHHGYNDSGADPVNQLCNPDIALWTIGIDSTGRDRFDMNLNWAMNKYLKENKLNYSSMDGNLTFDKNWKKSEPYSV